MHCLQCGHELVTRVIEDIERQVCPSCGWVHYNNPRPCVTALIMNDSNQILLARRAMEPNKGLWDFPGGFVERNEYPEAALRREIMEELQVDVVHSELLGFYPDDYGLQDISILNCAFLCKVAGKFQPDPAEFMEVKWFARNDLPEDLAFESMKRMLEDWILI